MKHNQSTFARRMAAALICLLAGFGVTVQAQIYNPAKWETTFDLSADGTKAVLAFKATIESGWHIYSSDIDPTVGPTPLQVKYSELEGLKAVGGLEPSQKAESHYDPNFDANLSWWESGVTLRQTFEVTATHYNIKGYLRYAACNDETCTPPAKEEFNFLGTANQAASDAASDPAAVEPLAEVEAEQAADTDSVEAAVTPQPALDTWAPVEFGDSDGNTGDVAGSSIWWVFVMCFLGGFVALLTPCVWPMIPLTVSFFLKRGKSKAKAVGDAVTYGLSIVVIYVLLGVIITVIFGADALNKMATSATCNIIFFLLLLVFAISFFGAFDIKLPEKWGTRMDAKAEKTTGLLSIFFMAFTLALVSFSCTGPIIGTLLVEAATTGDKMGPLVGMLGFSLALAIPFCLFALFPGWLNNAPRSGSWMNTVKVVLGFVELALSLKFLSVADLAYGWHILDRETFLALWIAIFGLLAYYLLGKFDFSHYGEPTGSVGTGRFFMAMISLAFTVYLIPGLWGAPLKSVSAFVPPLYTQDLNLYGRDYREYSDYDQALEASARDKRPVFVDFSGYGCVNCRKMEGAVLDNESVHSMIQDNFVVVTLMTDDRTPLPEPIRVEENGRTVTLDTYGEKWSYLQRVKFAANAQPYYVILGPDGRLMSGPFSYDENIPRFTRFLEKGLENYHERYK